LERSLSTGIIEKLFQCAAKPSDSETINDRIHPARREHGNVDNVSKPSTVIGARLDTSPGNNANGRNVTCKECEYSNEDGFGSFDVRLLSGVTLESRQVEPLSL